MDTTIQNEVNHSLFAVDEVLKDVEYDMEWEYHALLTFSIEWADICGQIKYLLANQMGMSEEQKVKFENLRERFDAVKGKLKALDLDNPFED